MLGVGWGRGDSLVWRSGGVWKAATTLSGLSRLQEDHWRVGGASPGPEGDGAAECARGEIQSDCGDADPALATLFSGSVRAGEGPLLCRDSCAGTWLAAWRCRGGSGGGGGGGSSGGASPSPSDPRQSRGSAGKDVALFLWTGRIRGPEVWMMLESSAVSLHFGGEGGG